jgi:hypothetical protein
MRLINADGVAYYDAQKKYFLTKLYKLSKAEMTRRLEQKQLTIIGDKYARAERLWSQMEPNERAEYAAELTAAENNNAAIQAVKKREARKRRTEKTQLEVQRVVQRCRTGKSEQEHHGQSEPEAAAKPRQPQPELPTLTCVNVGCNATMTYQLGMVILLCWDCNARNIIPQIQN